MMSKGKKLYLSLKATKGFSGLPDTSVVKESTCNAGDPSSIPGLGRSAGEGLGYPLQYSGLQNSRDYTVHKVPKSWTQLSDFHFHQLRTGSNFFMPDGLRS